VQGKRSNYARQFILCGPTAPSWAKVQNMSMHRFVAYVVLACWLGLTAVVVGTAIQWSAARGTSEVKIQRALNAQKDASAISASITQSASKSAPDDPQQTAEMQRSRDRAVSKAEEASDAMIDALNFEQVERKQFWWEFGVWGALTLLASALFAERRESDERSRAQIR
jgi:hypothetical protein